MEQSVIDSQDPQMTEFQCQKGNKKSTRSTCVHPFTEEKKKTEKYESANIDGHSIYEISKP